MSAAPSSPRDSRRRRQLLAAIGAAFICGPSLAAKPEDAGQGNGKKHKQRERNTSNVTVGSYFDDRQRTDARAYYGQQNARGRCPPGLAKKNNGCMPPGQAKKWALGRPLPGSVILYPVPREVVIRIGVPPPAYQYVRVVNDILLIAIGSRMVIDAIEDLVR